MKSINYLYYRLYQAALKSSLKEIPHITASAWLSGLVGTNLFVLNSFLSKTTDVPFLFPNPTFGGVFIAILIVLIVFYFNKEKRMEILDNYSEEDDEQRRKGNAITSVYVVVSFLIIFAVAFYKPEIL